MLVFLHPYKFTKFHYIRYELDFLEKKLNDKFEIHDLSKIVNPTWSKAFKSKKYEKVKSFNSIKEWELYFKNLSKKNKNLITYNLLDINSFKSLIVQIKLKKYCKKIIRNDDPGIPNFEVEFKNSFSWNIFKIKIIKVLKSPKSLLFFLKRKFLILLLKTVNFEKIIFLYHGKKKNFFSYLKSKKKIFINIHTPDYSRLIYSKNKKSKLKKPIGIFLDGPGPYFQNDWDLFQNKINYDVQKWYNDLNKFLFKLEDLYSCKILIIPHPKAKGLKNPYYGKKFRVCHDLDAVHKQIPQSKFVISIAGSTAVALACVCKIPSVLIYNNQLKKFNPRFLNEIEFLSKQFGSSLININKNYDDYLKPVNKKNCEKILYNYLTSKNISNKKNYQIFNKILSL